MTVPTGEERLKTAVSRHHRHAAPPAPAETPFLELVILQDIRRIKNDLATIEAYIAARLGQMLYSHFDPAEIDLLCFALGINYHDIDGHTHARRAAALVEYCDRHGRLPDLLKRIREERPNIPL